MREHLKRKRFFLYPIATAVVLLLAFILIPGPGGSPDARSASSAVAMVPQSFSQLAKSASPAVVNISTVKTVNGGGRVYEHFFRGPQGRQQDQFQNFFDQFFNNAPQREFKQKSLGSGFILDKQGHIVTNHHVIKDADEVQVKLKDGKEYDAEIIGMDPSTDLALIRIKADHDLPVLELGNSDQLEIGQWVVAIGSPFGLEHTVTAGIVSAKGRVIGAGPYDDFIQTDASINPGNSGGPLIDMKGAVVGINTAIVAGGAGIGFAIPATMAANVIEQLKEKGEVTRGWLGVGIQNLDTELKKYYGVDKGVLVAEVFPGEPAEKAGIKANDIILSINGTPVDSSRELSQTVSELDVGQTAKIKVKRGGDTKTFKATVGERDIENLAAGGRKAPGQAEDNLGVQVTEITPEIARRLGIEGTQGVIVANVQPKSTAFKAGLQRGDLIMEINHKAVKTTADYQRVIKGMKKDETIRMYIRRPRSGFMVITIK